MKKELKKTLTIILSLAMLLSVFGCSRDENKTETGTGGSQSSQDTQVAHSGALEDFEDPAREADGQFLLTGGSFTASGSTFTITSSGEYTLRGRLEEGRIVVDAGDDDEVILVLDDVYISSSQGPAILILNADEVKIRCEKGTYNTLRDLRSGVDSDEVYDAAVWSDSDMKITGEGILVVSSGYTNGIKSKNDLELKNLTLKVTSVGTALQGNDSVTMENGNALVISTADKGIKTKDSDISSKGNQRGDVSILAGRLTIYSASHGISSSHDVFIGSEEGDPEIYIYVSENSPFTDDVMKDAVSTGITSEGTITVLSGLLSVQGTGDGLHASGGVSLGNGNVSKGDIVLAGGEVIIQSGDDAIHADGRIELSGAEVTVPASHEGVEANVIEISDGRLILNATDDGINATAGNEKTAVYISGGYTDVTVTGDDVDAVDSNGDITITGGTVIARSTCSVNGMAGSFDCDGTLTVTGGTVIGIGGICKLPSADSVRVFVSEGLFLPPGSYVLASSDGTLLAEFALERDFTSVWVASEHIELGGSYTLQRDGSGFLGWSQDSPSSGSYESGGPFKR